MPNKVIERKIIAKTDIEPDYSQYLYVCKPDEDTGLLNIIQIKIEKSLKPLSEEELQKIKDLEIEKSIFKQMTREVNKNVG